MFMFFHALLAEYSSVTEFIITLFCMRRTQTPTAQSTFTGSLFFTILFFALHSSSIDLLPGRHSVLFPNQRMLMFDLEAQVSLTQAQN